MSLHCDHNNEGPDDYAWRTMDPAERQARENAGRLKVAAMIARLHPKTQRFILTLEDGTEREVAGDSIIRILSDSMLAKVNVKSWRLAK